MAIISEDQLLSLLKKSRRVLLLEPPYRRNYIPLGLAKISSFVKSNGGSVQYSRGPIIGDFDLICISSIFTTDSTIVLQSIRECQFSLFHKKIPIVVGGIFASLMPDYILSKFKFVSVFIGYSKRLDSYLPDYSLDYGIEGFFANAMTLFTQRGCPNKCGYCMVWRMEPDFLVCSAWKRNLEKIDRKICVMSDNNFLAASDDHVRGVIEVLNNMKKEVIFNNGVDCKLINDENAALLSSLTYTRNGFRTAFDGMDQDGYYQRAMERMLSAGFKIKGNSYTYVLFNFNDTPQEAYYRARECWKYGSNPYLMRYRPLNLLSSKQKHVGKYWTFNLVKAFVNYGALYGYNRKDGTFETWVNSYDSKLTIEDWDKWNYKR